MMNKLFLLSMVLFCAMATNAAAQKAYKRPQKFGNVTDYKDITTKEYIELIGQVSSGKTVDDPWVVFSDRSENPLYDGPDGKRQIGKLDLGEACVVTKEKNGWLQLYDARAVKPGSTSLTSGAVERGWVHIDHMLVWNTPLRNPISNIPIKAVIMNNISGLDEESISEKGTNVYSAPDGEDVKFKKSLYQFDFVYKKQGQRILIGSRNVLTSDRSTIELKGWINTKKVVEWATRIVLEPNFSKAAYEERQSDKVRQFHLFKSPGAAFEHADKLVVNENDLSLTWDPADKGVKECQQTDYDKYRFKGERMRLPMIEELEGGIYKTGVVGAITANVASAEGGLEFDQTSYKSDIQGIQRSGQKLQNVNVVFAIEANEYNQTHKAAITDLMRTTRNRFNSSQVKIGALLYTDDFKQPTDRIFKTISLSEDHQSVIDQVNAHSFTQPPGDDRWSALNYTLLKGVEKTGVISGETNVVVCIGHNGDFSRDNRARIGRKARAQMENSPSMIDENALVKKLSQYNAYLIFIQPSRIDESSYSSIVQYGRNAQNIIQQTANYIYKESADDLKLSASVRGDNAASNNPIIDDPDDVKSPKLKNSSVVGIIHRPNIGQQMSVQELVNQAGKSLEQINEIVLSMMKRLSNSLDDGVAFDANDNENVGFDYNLAVVRLIKQSRRQMLGRDPTDSEMRGLLTKLYANKTQIYTPAFVAKKLRDSKYPMIDYALFMHRKDYADYMRNVGLILDAYDYDDEEKRSVLSEKLNDMLEYFVGDRSRSYSSSSNDLSALRTLITGIKKEGLDIEGYGQTNFKFSELSNDKAVTPATLQKFFDDLSDKRNHLERYEDDTGDCTSCFEASSSEHRYYWVPVSLLL